MNAVTAFILAGLLISVSGCRMRESGDLGRFVSVEVQALGGRMASAERTPLKGRWTCQRDENGIVISSRDITFSAADSFLRAAYGAPVRSGTTPEGESQWTIPAKTAGCSIWYSKDRDGVRITIMKPFKL